MDRGISFCLQSASIISSDCSHNIVQPVSSLPSCHRRLRWRQCALGQARSPTAQSKLLRAFHLAHAREFSACRGSTTKTLHAAASIGASIGQATDSLRHTRCDRRLNANPAVLLNIGYRSDFASCSLSRAREILQPRSAPVLIPFAATQLPQLASPFEEYAVL